MLQICHGNFSHLQSQGNSLRLKCFMLQHAFPACKLLLLPPPLLQSWLFEEHILVNSSMNSISFQHCSLFGTHSVKVARIFSRRVRPVQALWSVCSIDLRVIALYPSFVNLRMPQNTSLVQLIKEPIRFGVFSCMVYKQGSSQYPEQIGDQEISTRNFLQKSYE